MTRRFRQHDVRVVTPLDGVWDFAFLGDVDPDTVEVGSIVFDDRMAVPGCFDATPAYTGKRGLTAYRTMLPLHDAGRYRLVFDGVHHWCRVFVDGEPLTEHVGGFTQFAVDVVHHTVGDVLLVVLVDNRFDYARCPLHLEYFDWYHYGGISRPVALHRLGDLWIDGVRIVTEDFATRAMAVTVTYGADVSRGGVPLTITVNGEKVHAQAVDVVTERGQIQARFSLPDAALWSPDAPNLHTLRVRLGAADAAPADDLYERFGIRQVRVAGQAILINDESLRLLGVNRHEAHPQFGSALPDSLLVSDMQQLRDLGCNFVRGSHYPQDARFLDLCDEAGILVWNEAIGWQHTAEHLTDPHFLAAQETNVREMVAVGFNHPSVILWGIQNESHSNDPACRPAYERLLGLLRGLDPTRLLTFASNHPYDDVCLDLADVVSINCYPGWYVGEIEDIPAELDNIIARLAEKGQGDKPLIISEIGAGAIYGWRDWNETRWSEQYQARLLDTVIRHLFVDGDRTCGLAIWQYCDLRASEEARRALFRPRAFNNKGLVDEYRRPKQAYDVVKALFRQLKS